MLQHMDLVCEKAEQASALVAASDIDLWLVFVRETRMQSDPVLPLLLRGDLTWDSFLAFHRDGRRIALVGSHDEEIVRADGQFTDIRPYVTGVGESLRQLLDDLDPETIALNYSADNPGADGLTHGMFLRFREFLHGTDYAERVVSGETLCAALRSRKTPAEISYVAEAARIANDLWFGALGDIAPGMTETQIADLLNRRIAAAGFENSFDTAVNAGDKTQPGHGPPTAATLERGDLLHVDFGITYRGYCSDLQRLVYLQPDGEGVPDRLTDAFSTVVGIIERTASEATPGRQGWEIDGLARQMLCEAGYPEYQHALGHQLGRSVHDGGAILGPRWERYGCTPDIPLEESNLFTLELEICLPGIGCVGLEEDVCIESGGARFLAPRQKELPVL
jgi:Xaa-Pro aminopeptidase